MYGGTSAGIAAAVIARRLGRSVSVAAFGRRIGGLSASGLGATDTGRIDAIGGLSREFYRRVGARYGQAESFRFEPHVAEDVFEAWVAEHGIDVFREQRLDTVRMSQDRILELRMESGLRFRAAMFIDATYEGDLLARAGRLVVRGPRGQRRLRRDAQRRPVPHRPPVPRAGRPVRRPGRPGERAAGGHLRRPAGDGRRGRPPHPGVQLPRLPHARGRPAAVPQAGGLRPRALRAAAALHPGRDLGRARQQPADAERQDRQEQQRRGLDRQHRPQLRLAGHATTGSASGSSRTTSPTSRG